MDWKWVRFARASTALADKRERLDAATSAGINTAPLKRQIAQIESDLAAAKKRVIEAFHRVPTNPYA
ncbi:hypothetical protein [Paraburkholderia sp. SIMBA_053]|uniref:hypothetical protein n=1 Tax=Paraburkholderia sp. SIMBA_053 TaxID=3085794 RepID=UPI0039794B33